MTPFNIIQSFYRCQFCEVKFFFAGFANNEELPL